MPTTYYVSAAGNDGNAGTSTGASKLTIAGAISASASGDTILCNGGDTFTETNSLTTPRLFDSYGTGQAILKPSSTSNYCLRFVDCGGASVNNLTFTGTNTGTPNNTTTDPDTFRPAAVEWLNDSGGTTKYTGLTFTNNTVTGSFITGLFVYSPGGTTSGYTTVTITGNTIHDCTGFGILLWSDTTSVANRYDGVTIDSNIVHDIPGYSYRICALPITAGFCGGVTNIRRNLCYTAGSASTNAGGGPAGIIPVYSNGVLIEHNEVYNIVTANGTDGLGIDLDTACTNCIVQYNYTHGCYKGGLALIGAGDNNIIRFNVSINDGVLDGRSIQANSAGTMLIYNNVIVNLQNYDGTFGIADFTSAASTSYFCNNIIVGNWPSTLLLKYATGSTFNIEGNCYFNPCGINITAGSTNYTSLAAFRSGEGKENNGGTPRGSTAYPPFKRDLFTYAYGNSATIESMDGWRLWSFHTLPAGLDLNSLFGLSVGSTDFAGTSITSATLPVGAYKNTQASTGTYVARVAGDSPVYHNRMNGAASPLTPTIDTGSWGNITLANGPLTQQTGAMANDTAGTCVSFDGVDDYGVVTLNLAGSTKVAVEFWFYYDSDADNILENNSDWTTANGGLLIQSALIGINASVKYGTISAPSVGWHHYAIFYEEGIQQRPQIRISRDGVPLAFTYSSGDTNSITAYRSAAVTLMARNNGGSLWTKGKLQDLAIYTDANVLTPGQEAYHFDAINFAGAAAQRPSTIVRQAINRASTY